MPMVLGACTLVGGMPPTSTPRPTALSAPAATDLRAGSPVPAERVQLLPGDVLGFSAGGSGRTDHVGLYVGADEFIHSSSSGVRVSSLRNSYWQESLVAARRIVE